MECVNKLNVSLWRINLSYWAHQLLDSVIDWKLVSLHFVYIFITALTWHFKITFVFLWSTNDVKLISTLSKRKYMWNKPIKHRHMSRFNQIGTIKCTNMYGRALSKLISYLKLLRSALHLARRCAASKCYDTGLSAHACPARELNRVAGKAL